MNPCQSDRCDLCLWYLSLKCKFPKRGGKGMCICSFTDVICIFKDHLGHSEPPTFWTVRVPVRAVGEGKKKNEKYSTITCLSELKIFILLFVGCLLKNGVFLESRKSLDMPKLVTSVSSRDLISMFGRKSLPLSNLSHPRVIRIVYTSRAETELKKSNTNANIDGS